MTGSSRQKEKPVRKLPVRGSTDTRAQADFWKRDPDVIKRFLGVRPNYEQLSAEVEYILRKRVTERGMETASITSRAKTLDSFLEKLHRKPYEKPFEEITDIAGVRTVCLYRSDISMIAEIIHANFEVIEDVDKLDDLAVDRFGYGARHFVVRLNKSSYGARYDDLKKLVCEVQVRTVVQDAWAIVQHHMVYKRESQVPSQLKRKLNSLSGLFETVDDQFERIREERDAYLLSVRDSAGTPATFLENELNLDSFKEYLAWAFPGRATESWEGQASMVLDGLKGAGHKTLRDVHHIVNQTEPKLKAFFQKFGNDMTKAKDGTIPSNWEPALALAFTSPDWKKLILWHPWDEKIEPYRNSPSA